MQSTLLFPYIKTATATFLASAAPKSGAGLVNFGFILAQAGGTDFPPALPPR